MKACFGIDVFCIIFGICALTNCLNTQYFISRSDVVDFVTSHERCSQHGGTLAKFKQTAVYDTSMRLKPNTFYWVEATQILTTKGGFTCVTLVVDGALNKHHLVDSNCSNKYKYICQLKDIPTHYNFASHFTDSTETVNLDIRPTSTQNFTEMFSVTKDLIPSFSMTRSTSLNPVLFGINIASKSVPPSKSSYSFSSKATSNLEISTLRNVSYYECSKNSLLESAKQANQTCNKIRFRDLCFLCRNNQEKPLVGEFTNLINISNTTNLDLFPELEINIKDTSKAHRKKTSASDFRPSTRAMGLAASFVIGSVVIIVVILDLPVIISQFRRIRAENTTNASEC